MLPQGISAIVPKNDIATMWQVNRTPVLVAYLRTLKQAQCLDDLDVCQWLDHDQDSSAKEVEHIGYSTKAYMSLNSKRTEAEEGSAIKQVKSREELHDIKPFHTASLKLSFWNCHF